MKTLLLASVALLCTAPQDPKILSLSMNSGDSMRAEVLRLEGGTATLRVLVLGGSMQVRRSLADFAPASAFRIEEAAAQPDSYDEHFVLAKRAAELGLVGPAGAQARAAAESVEGQADYAERVATLRAWAADALETMIRNAIEANDLPTARHDLKLLSTRLADLRTEEQLEALAAEVEGLEQTRRDARAAERQAKLDSKQRAAIARSFEPITAQVGAADKLYRQAVAKSRSTSQSSNLAERAIDNYRAAWQNLQKLQERHPDDAEVAREVVALGARIQEGGIRAALHAANVLTVQSDYKSAMEWCDRILALDPENFEAKDMKRTIQVAAAAASSQWGWGWGMPVVGPTAGPTPGGGRPGR